MARLGMGTGRLERVAPFVFPSPHFKLTHYRKLQSEKDRIP